MTAIDITQLTDEQKKALQNQLKKEEKAKKEKKAQDSKALKDLAEGTVPMVFELLKNVSNEITKAKEITFRTFEDFLKLKIETMGIKAKDQKSYTITHGKQSVKLGYRITDGYTDEAGYGLAMVHKFLDTLGTDENSRKLLNIAYKLLSKNKKGDLDSKKVADLKQFALENFPDTEFDKGVDIIQKAYKPRLSKWFIEAWEIDGVGIEQYLPLSITRAELPKDIDLSFLLPQE